MVADRALDDAWLLFHELDPPRTYHPDLLGSVDTLATVALAFDLDPADLIADLPTRLRNELLTWPSSDDHWRLETLSDELRYEHSDADVAPFSTPALPPAGHLLELAAT